MRVNPKKRRYHTTCRPPFTNAGHPVPSSSQWTSLVIHQLGGSCCTLEGLPGHKKDMERGPAVLLYSSLSLGRSLRVLEVRVPTGAFTKMNACNGSERGLYLHAVLC